MCSSEAPEWWSSTLFECFGRVGWSGLHAAARVLCSGTSRVAWSCTALVGCSGTAPQYLKMSDTTPKMQECMQWLCRMILNTQVMLSDAKWL